MARTAPAPNIPPIPGMCPGMIVLAGGGGGGGGSGGSGKNGKGKKGAKGKKGKKDPKGAGKNAPDPKKYPKCGTKAHPVDVVTGRAFTHEVPDLEMAGPLELEFERMYSVSAKDRDVGLGWGWSHSFAWRVEILGKIVRVWNDQGMPIDFPAMAVADGVIGPYGWALRRETWGYILDTDEEVFRLFSAPLADGATYLLTAVEDFNRNRISLTYDGNKLVEIVDSAGRTVRVQTTKEGRMASIAVKNAPSQGRWIEFAKYRYDAQGNLLSVTDADGQSYQYAYDDKHRMVSDTDRCGLTFHFRFDKFDRCTESWGAYDGRPDPSLGPSQPRYLADGATIAKGIHHCRFIYNDDGSSEVIDSTQVIRYFGNEFGTIEKEVEGGAVETCEYDEQGNMIALTDAGGHTTRWEHDERGRMKRVIDATGVETKFEYDGYGLPTRIDEAGFVNEFHRDARGNPEAVVDAAGNAETYKYDQRGLPIEYVSAMGARVLYTWDAAGNLIEETYPSGAKKQYEYNAFGWVTLERDVASGAEFRHAYSDRGDLLAIYYPDGGIRRFQYDGEERVIQETSAAGQTTKVVWGGYEKVCALIDANGRAIRFVFNREGELIEVLNEAGERWLYEYDLSGRLIGETTFDGRHIRYRRDGLDQVTRVTNESGEHTDYVYDPVGEIIERTLGDGSSEAFEHDARGLLLAAKSDGILLEYEYDALGRATKERQTVGGVEHWVAWEWDPDGELRRRWTSLDHTEEVTRDAMGSRVTTVLDGRFVIRHENDLEGAEVRKILPQGGEILTTYNVMGGLERLRVLRRAGAGPITAGQPERLDGPVDRATIDRSFHYDNDGRLLDRHDRGDGQTRYEYDPIGQILSRLPERAMGETYFWEARGNPVETGGKRVYGPGNKLLSKGSTEYRYDQEGRLVERSELGADGTIKLTTYEWKNTMLAAVASDDVRLEFAYDAFGRRMLKRELRPNASASGAFAQVAITRFVWDGDVLVHELRQEVGQPREAQQRTYWFDDAGFEPLAQRDGTAAAGDWWLYVNDTSGAPTELVDAAGERVATLDRTLWGKPRNAAEAMGPTTPLRFQGQYEDVETGLSYNRFRYYDSDTGMFVSPDPIGMQGGINNYAYANDPIAWIDPAGLKKKATAAQRAASTPSSPGIYTIESTNPRTGKKEWYVGQGVDVKGRLCSKGHKKANKLLKRPGSKLTVRKVDLSGVKHKAGKGGYTKAQADKRTLHVAERKEYNRMKKKYPKGKTLNSHPPLGDKKYPTYSKKYPPKTGRPKSY